CRTRVEGLTAEDVTLHVRFNDLLGRPITTLSTRFNRIAGNPGVPELCTFSCVVPRLDLAEDSYSLDVWIDVRGVAADFLTRAAELQVAASNRFGTGFAPISRWHGAAILAHSWRVEDEATARHADTLTHFASTK